jgi:nucleotide-binding universal stress UspA family protein
MSLMASAQSFRCREFGGHGEWLSGVRRDGAADPVRAAGPFRRILAGFDGSPDAAEAVRAAAAIAARDGGHVVALTVVRRAPRADGDEDTGGDGRNIREQAEALVDDLRRELAAGSAVRMSVQIVYTDRDSPARVVTEYAAEHGFDVLVLGRHGDGRRRKSRLGQVADQAVQACSVPVLLLGAR